MARKRDEWITSAEAADTLTKNSEHKILPDYVRRLGNTGKIEVWEVDGRTRLYNKADVEKYRVKKRGDGSVRRTVRKDAREKTVREQTESAA